MIKIGKSSDSTLRGSVVQTDACVNCGNLLSQLKDGVYYRHELGVAESHGAICTFYLCGKCQKELQTAVNAATLP